MNDKLTGYVDADAGDSLPETRSNVVGRAWRSLRRRWVPHASGPDATPTVPDPADLEFFEPRLGLDLAPYIAAEDQQGIHHLGRYHWALQVLEDHEPGRVLDVACGSGYGSFLIAERLSDSQVLGADYDQRAVDYAMSRYARPNLSYGQGNVVTWQLTRSEVAEPLGTFDAIVSFDTLEHLLHREIALMRIVENLSADGVFLFSTPCTFSNKLFPDWSHHKIEYGFDDLRNLLGRFFGKVLAPEDGNLPHIEFWNDVINKDKPRYWNRMNPVVCLEPIRR